MRRRSGRQWPHPRRLRCRPAPDRTAAAERPREYAAEAAAAIRADVQLITWVLLAAFLGWRYRSVLLLGLVAVPLTAIAHFAATALPVRRRGAVASPSAWPMLGVGVELPDPAQ